MWDGKLQNIYHYHLNNEFPYAVGCFRGKVDYSKALGSADMRAHNKIHGTPNKAHDHKGHGVPNIIKVPIGPFQ
jgi:hypothetical protein